MARLLYTLLAWAFLSGGAMANDALISEAEVDACLAAHLPTWKERLAAQPHPRLVFAGTAAVEKFREAMDHPDTEQTRLLQQLKATADGLVKAPVVKYLSPAEIAKTGKTTAWHARSELWERPVGDGMIALALAGLLWDDPKYNAKLKQTVLAACRYPTWGVDDPKFPNNDLPCDHLARGIAIAYDWHPDLWSPEEIALIEKTMATRVDALYGAALGKSSFWARDYAANHEHNGVAALGIAGAAFLGEIPTAERWLAVAKVAEQRIAENTHDDGTSPEGIPYWSYGMSFLLSYIECTRRLVDSDDLYKNGYFQHLGAYRLHSSTCDLGKTLPWGDAPERDYYGPQHLLFRAAAEFREPGTQWLALHLPFAPTGFADVKAWELLWYDSTLSATPPVALDHLFPVGQMATSRSGWEPGDYLLAIKAGKTHANHSHLDAGAIALAFGPDWLLTAPGYGKGAEDPGYWEAEKRWTYYANATEAESTLLINGQNQRTDSEARGVIDDFLGGWKWNTTRIDLSQAYHGVSAASRLILHRRGGYILVIDRVEAPQPVRTEWLLQAGGQIDAAHNALEMKAPAGTLRAQMLVPPLAFAPRAPTSPHLDAPHPVHTFAISQEGREALFACLLQPCFAQRETLPIEATVVPADPAILALELKSADATDSVRVQTATGPLEIAAPASVHAIARALVVRWNGENPSSLTGTEAQRAAWPGGSLEFSSPVSFALEKLPRGAWVLDVAGATAARLDLGLAAATLVTLDEEGRAQNKAALHENIALTKGRYLILPEGMPVPKFFTSDLSFLQ